MNKMNTIKKLAVAAFVAVVGLCGTAWAGASSVPYMRWVGVGQPLVEDHAGVSGSNFITPTTAKLESGWYVVQGSVTNTTGGIVVDGDAHLILADGAELVVTGAYEKAGIEVGVAGSVTNSLTIYGQVNQTGKLLATGNAGCAGIGGNKDESCGKVTINGGIVTTTVLPKGDTGGSYSAGIGGGKEGCGGVITINAGKVTATGCMGAVGIGTGGNEKEKDESDPCYGAGCVITINGGEVTAVGGAMACGIGGAQYGGAGKVIINGGTVTANGGAGGPGIGAGVFGEPWSVTITGGRVRAFSYGDFLGMMLGGAGIGGCLDGNGGTVKITGGEVEAISYPLMTYYGEGIGAGALQESETPLSSGTLDLSGYAGTYYIYAGMDTNGVEVTEVQAADYATVWHTNLYVQITQTKRQGPAAPESDFEFDSATGTITGYKGPGGDVTIPATIGGVAVKAIGENAFSSASLNEVVIPEGVTNIGENAFYSSALTKVVIPASVKEIGEHAFEYCSYLADVSFAEDSQLEVIRYEAFRMCSSLPNVTIPASVKEIGKNAFWKCQELVSVAFSDGSRLESIGETAFSECEKLAQAMIPASVTNIMAAAFLQTALTEVTIPAGVVSIGAGAFAVCPALTNVTVLATTPPQIGTDYPWDLFLQSDALTAIHVPMGTVEGYTGAAGWSTYADLITDGTTPAAETVETTYYAWNETKKAIDGPMTVNAIPVTADMTELNSGWYVVQGQVVIDRSGITDETLYKPGLKVNGDVHLILADDAKLVVTGVAKKAGIEVAVVGSVTNSLTIYGQEAGTGFLDVFPGDDGRSASIGGCYDYPGCGRVRVDGGHVQVYALGGGAGIGGGCKGSGANSGGFGGDITINGGTVTAVMGDDSGSAGIGGGWCSKDGSVTINDGHVTVVMDDDEATGAGIGTGAVSEGFFSVTINGGTIDVNLWYDDDDGSTGAGIGNGYMSSGVGEVTINGGAVTSRSMAGAGIGSGILCAPGVKVEINGGTVFAEGGRVYHDSCNGGAGIGGGSASSGADVLINGGTVTAIAQPVLNDDTDKIVWSSGVGAGCMADPGLLEMYEAQFGVGSYVMGTFALGPNTTAKILSGMDTNGVVVTEVAAGDYGSLTSPGWCTNCYVKITAADAPAETVETTYYAWNEEKKAIDGPYTTNAIPVTADMETLGSGWYVVNGAVTNTTGGIVVDGDAHLILADGAELVVTGALNRAGILVTIEGAVTNSLSIYGQLEGNGVLDVVGGQRGAGIGGVQPGNTMDYKSAGLLFFHGGTTLATTEVGASSPYSWSGAAIGGGSTGDNVGKVVYYGGTVEARGKLVYKMSRIEVYASAIGSGVSLYAQNVAAHAPGAFEVAEGSQALVKAGTSPSTAVRVYAENFSAWTRNPYVLITKAVEGTRDMPWNVGPEGAEDTVQAYTNGMGDVVILGSGTIAGKPWLEDGVRETIGRIVVEKTDLTIPDDAFSGMGAGKPIDVKLPDGWQGKLPGRRGNWHGAVTSISEWPLTLRNVKFAPNATWNGYVNISCEVSGSAKVVVNVNVFDGETKLNSVTMTGETYYELDGHRSVCFTWDPVADLGADFKSENIKVVVGLSPAENDGMADGSADFILVRNGSAQMRHTSSEADAQSYLAYVTSRDADLLKNGLLLFRKVAPGVYPGVNGRANTTMGFWMMVNEVCGNQVRGWANCLKSNDPNKLLPVTGGGNVFASDLSYVAIRGTNDPNAAVVKQEVSYGGAYFGSAGGFILDSELQSSLDAIKNYVVPNYGLPMVDSFDLPTEAQWEIACRAGTTTKWSCGDDASALPEYAVFGKSVGDWSEVGTEDFLSGKPNGWYFYGMHGNAWEYCRDAYSEAGFVGTDADKCLGLSPAALADFVVVRGGCCTNTADECASSARERARCYNVEEPDPVLGRAGFRLVLPMLPKYTAESAVGSLDMTTADLEIAAVVSEAGETLGTFRSVQDAFDSEFTADMSVTNTVRLLKDFTEDHAWRTKNVAGLTDFSMVGSTALGVVSDQGVASPRTARLDLNGKAFTGGRAESSSDEVQYPAGIDVSPTLAALPGSVLVIDDGSIEKTGAIGKPASSVEIEASPTSGEYAAMITDYLLLATLVSAQGDLTLAGGTIHGAPTLVDGIEHSLGVVNYAGKFTMTGGAIVDCAPEGDGLKGGIAAALNAQVRIAGGKVKDAISNLSGVKFSVSGGLFGTADVSNNKKWLAPNAVCLANDDPATREAYPWKVVQPAESDTILNVPASPHGSYVVCTNGIPVELADGRTARTLVLKDAIEIEVVYTADEGYLLDGRPKTTWFVGADRTATTRTFTVTRPKDSVGTLGECIAAQPFEAVRDIDADDAAFFSLDLPDETLADGESYFWVAFRSFLDNDISWEDEQKITERRNSFAVQVLDLVDRSVGAFEKVFDKDVYSYFANVADDFFGQSGEVSDLSALPASLPFDTVEVYVFRVRAGANGKADSQVVAVGGNTFNDRNYGRWTNEIVGETVTMPYCAWDAAEGKVKPQAPVEAITLSAADDFTDVVLHGNRWYALFGNRQLRSLRVDVGTAHLIVADGAELYVNGARVAADAKLAVYAEKDPDESADGSQAYVSIGASEEGANAVSGGALEVHGNDVRVSAYSAEAIRNRRTVLYGGRLQVESSGVCAGAVNSLETDVFGGRFAGEVRSAKGDYPTCVVAGEQDGAVCAFNVHFGAYVELSHSGISSLGSGSGLSAIAPELDVRLDDGVYAWSADGRGSRKRSQLTTVAIYRARPKAGLMFCSSCERLVVQDFQIVAAYDESVKTNGFTMTLPAEELGPGETWVVIGFDETMARRTGAVDDLPIAFADAFKLQYAQVIALGSYVAGVDIAFADLLAKGFGSARESGYLPTFVKTGVEAEVEIPASAGVDLVLVGRAFDTPELPVLSLGVATYLQSMADGEAKGNEISFVTKQEFSVDPGANGGFVMTMPEGDELAEGERWAWLTLASGYGDNERALAQVRSLVGTALPVGVLTYDMLREEFGQAVPGCGTTTDRTIQLPTGSAAVLVGKVKTGLTRTGISDTMYVTMGMASYLNDPGHAPWPRHDELFPNEGDYCKVTIPENGNVALIVAVNGEEVDYRPDGVYSVKKGSEVRVAVLLLDAENYELRSPSMLVYTDIQEDVTVGPQQVVVVPKAAPTPVADQGFVVRRGEDGALTVDMSGEEPLGLGEMWVCMTIDKGGSDLPSLDGDTGSFGDIIWRDGMGVIADVNAGDLPLDLFLVVPGAEGVVVSTNETFAIPSDSEMALVARAYDGYNGKVGGNRYYGLSLGGVRFLTALRPGEAVEGERWNSEHKVRYSAWDGEKVVHGLVTNALPLTAASFDANGVLKVTSSCFYAVTGKVRGESARLSIDVAPGATLSLLVKDGSSLELRCINLPSTATLNVYGQDNGSGVMTFPSIPLDMAAIGGTPEEGGCGTINFHGPRLTAGSLYLTQGTGALQALGKGKIDSYAVIGGSLSSVAESGGALNVYRGVVDIIGRGNCAIGGYKPMQVNVRGGKVVVHSGAVGGMDLDTRVSGITLGAGYKLQCEVEEETVEMTVAEYDKLLTDGNPPNGVRIVRPAAVTFDAEIAKLVADGKLTMMVRPAGGLKGGLKKVDPVWTEEGGTYPVDCGDSLYVIALVNGTESVRRPDVMTFGSVTGDVAVTLADLNWHEPELVAEQKFEAYRCLDGRVRLTPKGRLGAGEAWLWIALPDYVARQYAGDLTIAEKFAKTLKTAVDSKACYVGGVMAAGGTPVAEPMLRPLYNCVQGNTFLPTDGFHWGVSREKSVFYAPADTDFAVLCKVYDAGVAQMMFASSKQSAPAEAAEAAAEAAQAEAQPALKAVAASATQLAASSINVNKDLFLTVGCRYTAETAGSAMNLQALPRLPEYEPGDVHNPWPLGPEDAEEPVAYTNDTNTLVIDGVGPFAEPTKKPWLEEGVGPITEIVIKDPETELPDDIFEGLGTPEPIGVDLPDGWPADDLPVPGQPWHGGYVKIEEGHWPLTISNVKFQQRYPWNGLVDITFDLTGSTNVELGVWAKSGATTVAASNFVGRTDMMFAVEAKKTVKLVWDAEKDALPGDLTKLVLENTTITVGTDSSAGSGSGGKVFRFSDAIPEGVTSAFKSPIVLATKRVTFDLEPGDEIVVEAQYVLQPQGVPTSYLTLCAPEMVMGLDIPEPSFALYKAANGDFAVGEGKYRFAVTEEVVEAFKSGKLLLWWGYEGGRGLFGHADTLTVTDICIVKPGGGIGAVSAAGLIDLAKGTRVARDLEGIVVDPAWGAAATASVLWPKAETAREYDAATVDTWNTARLPAGKYEFAYSAGATDYTAAFWVPADRWAVIDHETITGERPVTGEKLLVTGENVIKAGGKLIIAGEPEIIWDGTFRVEKGGKIYAPYFDVVVDPETGLVTLEPKDRPTVTGLRFAQRYPWNGLVDVFFTATYAKDPAAKVWVKLAAKLDGEEKQVKTLYLASDPATTNTQFQVAQGEVHLIWDTMKDVGLENFGALEITAQAALIRMAEEAQPEEESKLLCLTARGGSLFVSLYSELFGSAASFSPDLEYSKDGITWTKYIAEKTKAILVEADESVYLRGVNPNGWNPPDLEDRADSLGLKPREAAMTIDLKGMTENVTVEASGSVMSLIDGKGEATEIPDENCFVNLFSYDQALTKAPDLTATTLKHNCYEYMFRYTSVDRIRILAADDLEQLFSALYGVTEDLEGGTLVLNPCWKGVDFSEILPSSWQIVFDGEEQGGDDPSGGTPMPLRLEAVDAGDFLINYDGKDAVNLEISTNGKDWTPYKFGGKRMECKSGDVVYVRGKNPKGLTQDSSYPVRFDLSGRWSVSGNVMSLIDYEKEVTEIPCEYCFSGLFATAQIATADLELPATVLKPYCYQNMFASCSLMEGRIVLPAKDLVDGCYEGMFNNCNNLSYIKMLAETYNGDSKKFGEVLLKDFKMMLNNGAGKAYGGIFVYSSNADVSAILPQLIKLGAEYNWSVVSESEEKEK